MFNFILHTFFWHTSAFKKCINMNKSNADPSYIMCPSIKVVEGSDPGWDKETMVVFVSLI